MMGVARNRKLIAGLVAGVLVAGGGGALAATQLGSSGVDSQAVINDAAQQLGVDPGKLSDALRKALADQIDSLVASGRLTKEQGDALKARIQAGQAPLFGGLGLGRFGFGHLGGFASLDAAASYLGLSTSDLRSELAGGKTLAQVAREHGKSVDGLVSALVDAAKQKLDAAVAAGRLTQAEEDSIVAGLKQEITDAVNGTGGHPFLGHGFRPQGDRMWGGPRGFRGPIA